MCMAIGVWLELYGELSNLTYISLVQIHPLHLYNAAFPRSEASLVESLEGTVPGYGQSSHLTDMQLTEKHIQLMW